MTGFLRRSARLLRERVRLRKWLKLLKARHVELMGRIHLTGRSGGFQHIRIGANAIIEQEVTIWVAPDGDAAPELVIGERAFIGRNTYIGLFKEITIGSHTLIGAYSYLISANHQYARRDIPIIDQGYNGAPIIIAEDVWIGTHVIVLPGVAIGKGAIVAAGSLVNRDIPPYEVWGGIPAKFLKNRP